MDKVTNPDKRDVIRSIIYILIYVTVIGVGAIYLLPDYWFIWAGLVLAGMLLFVNWHKQKTAYRCPNCDHVYEISFLTDMFAPHGFNREGAWQMLRCPGCRVRSKTRTLKKVEQVTKT